MSLASKEVKCPVMKRKYFSIYEEQHYKKILLNSLKRSNSRGAEVYQEDDVPIEELTEEPKTYALIIATNNYQGKPSWKNLKNPINDAESVANIFSKKYNAETVKIYNKPKDTVLYEILRLKKRLREQDKLIMFIAGHGYYSQEYADGYVVFTDSKALESDFSLASYMQMASLNRMIDNLVPKNVFVIFDICFGASFDLNARDLSLSDYKELQSDISLEEFIKRKSESYSRIFLASGRYEVPDYWKDITNHSPFAEKLLAALSGEMKFVSPGKLYVTLEGNVTEPFLKQFGRHDERGDFLVAVSDQ